MNPELSRLWSPEIDGKDTPQEIQFATVNQRQAADPDSTVWVAASAGTGKTRVLTNRVLSLLLEGAEPRQILALTFTKAAASEMANRVSEALEVWVTLSDADLSESIFKLAGYKASDEQLPLARRLFARVLEAPGGLNIQTIHAFAQSLLGRFPVEAGIQPGFKVLDDMEASSLLEKAVEGFLVRQISSDEPKIAQVFEALGEDAFHSMLSGLVRERGRLYRLQNDKSGNDGVASTLSPLRMLLGLELDDSRHEAIQQLIFAEGVPKELKAALGAYAQWYSDQGLDPKPNSILLANALEWSLLPDAKARLTTLGDFLNLFETSTGTLRKVEKVMLSKFQKAHPRDAEIVLEEARRVGEIRSALKGLRLVEISESLLETAFEVLDRYTLEKNAISRLDFDDLILRTITLLTGEEGAAQWVSYKLDQGLKHVLVDEAQDTNPDQWSIVGALTSAFYDGTTEEMDRARTTFVVGDLKQSIYGFQRADPQVFRDMKQQFKTRVDGASDVFRWIDSTLNVTFRSAQPILNTVNAVFEYRDNAQGLKQEGESWPTHVAGLAKLGGLVEVWEQIEATPKPAQDHQAVRDDNDLDDDDRPEVEFAKVLGQRIAEWTSGEAQPGEAGWLANHHRPMRAGDIMILVRSRSGPFINVLTQTLKRKGVAVAGADRMKLLEQLAVQDLVCLTEYLLQPEDSLALATVLRSPLVDMSEDELFRLAHRRGPKESLESALAKAAELGSLSAVAARTLINQLRSKVANGPHDFYAYLLSALGGRQKFELRLGPQAIDALTEFLRAALTFERNNVPTLPGFLGWLHRADIEVKRDQDSEGGGVRIMTVHGSKGLEAPVVILPQTQRKMGDTSRDRLRWFPQNDGPPLPYWMPTKTERPEGIAELDEADKRRTIEEERRLLYVAMTRAEERLYIGGWKTRSSKNPSESTSGQSWYEAIVEALRDDPNFRTVESPADQPARPILRHESQSKVERQEQVTSALGADTQPIAPEKIADLLESPPTDPLPPRPFAPSQLLEEPAAPSPLSDLRILVGREASGKASKTQSPFFRGTALHGLLQRLPEVALKDRAAAAERYLRRPSLDLTDSQVRDWAQEALAVVNDGEFAPLFGPGSQAEVSITGLVGKLVVSGQIDRLIEFDDAVWIVDYKSNRPPPTNPAHVAESYRAQLAAYKAVLMDLYPAKAIRTFLLWTETPRLMEVPVSEADLPTL